MIYEDEKIEWEKWRATVTATLVTATIPGTIQTLMSFPNPIDAISPSLTAVAVMVARH